MHDIRRHECDACCRVRCTANRIYPTKARSNHSPTKLNCMKPPIRVLRLLFPLFWTCHVLSPASLPARETASYSQITPILVVKLGYTDDGAITPVWRDAIRARHDAQGLAALLAGKKELMPEGTLWVEFICGKAAKWPAMIDSLRIPFKGMAAEVWIAACFATGFRLMGMPDRGTGKLSFAVIQMATAERIVDRPCRRGFDPLATRFCATACRLAARRSKRGGGIAGWTLSRVVRSEVGGVDRGALAVQGGGR